MAPMSETKNRFSRVIIIVNMVQMLHLIGKINIGWDSYVENQLVRPSFTLSDVSYAAVVYFSRSVVDRFFITFQYSFSVIVG